MFIIAIQRTRANGVAHSTMCMLYLGGEVSVKYALAVQVLQPSGNIQRQTNPGTPRKV